MVVVVCCFLVRCVLFVIRVVMAFDGFWLFCVLCCCVFIVCCSLFVVCCLFNVVCLMLFVCRRCCPSVAIFCSLFVLC